MKKLAVMIAIASILSGCMTKDSLNTLKKLVVEKEIKDYVASNYPIESLEIDLLSSEIYDNCMDVINISQLSLVKIELNKETRYVLKSSVDTKPLKKCIDNYLAKKPVSNDAMEDLISNPYYEKYKNEPDVREIINKAKIDNLITYHEQKEILDLVKNKRLNQALAENKIWYQKQIHFFTLVFRPLRATSLTQHDRMLFIFKIESRGN
ncbi:hypothetical protein MNL33_18965 [Acinetobacter baumannii]|uniref:hypothetical protein n=9 Tax=Acinetobacter baumannii TaxID=470 RepID=UPI001FAC6F3F|nr:hypothetical protein [Acinetobacter baumannii]MCJ0773557.1 hypothetical protein [Acinetobacter baumannii]